MNMGIGLSLYISIYNYFSFKNFIHISNVFLMYSGPHRHVLSYPRPMSPLLISRLCFHCSFIVIVFIRVVYKSVATSPEGNVSPSPINLYLYKYPGAAGPREPLPLPWKSVKTPPFCRCVYVTTALLPLAFAFFLALSWPHSPRHGGGIIDIPLTARHATITYSFLHCVPVVTTDHQS